MTRSRSAKEYRKPPKTRLISKQSIRPTRPQKPGLDIIKSFFAVAISITLIFVAARPLPAHAGILSFLSDIINPPSEAAEEAPNNTQKMAVLEQIYTPATSSAETIDLNIINKNTLVADSGPIGSMADVSNAKSDQISVYVVRSGDTLTTVAKLFDVTENTIRWANDIKKGSPLKEGQELVILPISGVQYTVKKGDSIKSIAKKFGGDPDDIIDFNDLSTDSQLAVGDTIIIPDGDMPESTPITPKSKKIRPEINNYPSYAGYYVYPLDGGRKTQGIHGYNGVDLANACGAEVYAAAEGQVILSRGSGSYNGGYGNYVIISHSNGTQTLYAHMSQTTAVTGQTVSRGQLIGYEGHTGKTRPKGPRGCHLHFEVRGAKNPF